MFKKIFLLLALAFALSLHLASFSEVMAQTLPGESIDSSAFRFNLTPITNENIEGSVRQEWIRGGVNYFFERIIGFLAAIIGTLAVLMLTVGGFLMLSSAGNEQRYEQGKNYAKFSLIGLAITLSAYILVTLVQLLINSIYG